MVKKGKFSVIKLSIFSLVLVLFLTVYGACGANEEKKSESATAGVSSPPPAPPPISEEEISKIVITDPYVIPEDVLLKMMKERQKKDYILQELLNQRYGTVKKETLKEVNFFYYHPQFPVVFFFDGKKVEKIVVYGSKSLKVYYKDDTVVFLPGSADKEYYVSSFVVFFEDGDSASFVGERSILNSQRPVMLRYSYVKPVKMSPEDVMALFFRSFNRCPEDGEVVKVGEKHFKFHVKSDGLLIKKNDVSACGKVYEVIEM